MIASPVKSVLFSCGTHGYSTVLRKGLLNRHTRYRPATTARNTATQRSGGLFCLYRKLTFSRLPMLVEHCAFLAAAEAELAARSAAFAAAFPGRKLSAADIEADEAWHALYERRKALEREAAAPCREGGCSFWIARRRRFCSNAAADGLGGLCSEHAAKAAAAVAAAALKMALKTGATTRMRARAVRVPSAWLARRSSLCSRSGSSVMRPSRCGTSRVLPPCRPVSPPRPWQKRMRPVRSRRATRAHRTSANGFHSCSSFARRLVRRARLNRARRTDDGLTRLTRLTRLMGRARLSVPASVMH